MIGWNFTTNILGFFMFVLQAGERLVILILRISRRFFNRVDHQVLTFQCIQLFYLFFFFHDFTCILQIIQELLIFLSKGDIGGAKFGQSRHIFKGIEQGVPMYDFRRYLIFFAITFLVNFIHSFGLDIIRFQLIQFAQQSFTYYATFYLVLIRNNGEVFIFIQQHPFQSDILLELMIQFIIQFLRDFLLEQKLRDPIYSDFNRIDFTFASDILLREQFLKTEPLTLAVRYAKLCPCDYLMLISLRLIVYQLYLARQDVSYFIDVLPIGVDQCTFRIQFDFRPSHHFQSIIFTQMCKFFDLFIKAHIAFIPLDNILQLFLLLILVYLNLQESL